MVLEILKNSSGYSVTVVSQNFSALYILTSLDSMAYVKSLCKFEIYSASSLFTSDLILDVSSIKDDVESLCQKFNIKIIY